MNKVKSVVLIGLFFFAFGGTGVFSQVLSLDNAIERAVNDIKQGVPRGTKIAVVNITTEFVDISDYVVNELIVQLVNARMFQVVPRSEVELKANQQELNFQMSGYVSDQSAKSIGKFLAAGSIITGNFSKDSSNSYRLIINAVDVESFTYQSSYRASIANDNKTKSLVMGTGKELYQDYTAGERLGTGALNIFFGLGSGLQGDDKWWINGLVEGIGVAFLIGGLLIPEVTPEQERKADPGAFETEKALKSGLIYSGVAIAGVGIIIGFARPFFYHKPNKTGIALKNPENWDIAFVSTNGYSVNGLRLSYMLHF